MNASKDFVKITAGPVELQGDLTIPTGARGVVMFVHGSGSSRMSPRNHLVAQILNDRGIATLLFDLLTAEEEEVDIYTMQYRFDIALLAQRLVDTTEWVTQNPDTATLHIGYFGASTGAGAALMASVHTPHTIRGIVSRGGRPDLASAVLPKVQTPTLCIVGGNDRVVVDLNKQALDQLEPEKDLIIVEGATHLFEEPGTLEKVADLAACWFEKHFDEGGSSPQDE